MALIVLADDGIEFDHESPARGPLGGAESSVVNLSKELAARGHQMTMAVDSTAYGRGQIILRDPQSGVYCGGTEPRTDSSIAVF